jgi:triphosphatase
VEIELKFQVPAESLKRLQRTVATKTAQQVTLRARYVDTPDGRLAAARIALRLRLEGAQWVQTVKAPGTGPMQRLEHEVAIDAPGGEPRIDIARHAGTAVGAALERALGDGGARELETVFETNVQRTLRWVRHAGALIEVALDLGEITAAGQRLAVCEIEFELKRGNAVALPVVAAAWVQRHGLWLDVRSKAERGLEIAGRAGDAAFEPERRPPIGAHLAPEAALRALVAACLTQVLPAMARVADGDGAADPLHRLRVGLRRLRCVLRLFGDWSAEVDATWPDALATLFGRLGSARDRDVVADTVSPALRAAGAPLADLAPAPHDEHAVHAVRDPACTTLLLSLIGFAHGVPNPSNEPADRDIASLPERAFKVMRKLRRRLARDAEDFDKQDDDARHRTRKRLKRWRYGLEFMAPLYASKGVKRCLSRVRAAQELLGRNNDLAVAEAAFRELAASDARAWFAVGWLAASRAALVAPAQEALRDAAAAAARLSPADTAERGGR